MVRPGRPGGVVILPGAAISLATALVVITAAFGAAWLRGRYDTVDAVWGAGFVVIAMTGLVVAPAVGPAALLTVVLVGIWGLRLSWHILRRNVRGPEDARYREMYARASRFPVLRMFVRVYLTQALVMWFVSAPVQAVLYTSDRSGIGVLGVAGILVWLAGFVFEAVADEQLRRFKADPANAGAVLDRGLWRYTRHPNYFGDACVWWGLYLLACVNWVGVATIAAPLVMTWLLARGTGKPLLERGMRATRDGYAGYVARTSGFVPLPPRSRRY